MEHEESELFDIPYEESEPFDIPQEEDAPEFACPMLLPGGCTAAPYGYVCTSVVGYSTYIAVVQAARGKADGSLICNWQAVMYVNDASGRRIYTRWSPVQHRCDVLRAWYDFSPVRFFPVGAWVCTSFYEDGVKQGGSPCLRIKK